MEKKIAGLLGAMATLGALNGAQASPAPAPSDPLKVNSYADLLEPIPNALKVLQAIEEQSPVKPWEDNVKVAQYYYHHHHHGYYHHHHHHGYYHHHHHGYYYGPRVYVVPPRRFYHHHHHHHHHHGYYRDY
jgi:hypothetical protein